VVAAANATLVVAVNGSQIGTIVFSQSDEVSTFTTDSGTAKELAHGDILTVTAPGSADASLADIAVTLQGFRTGTDL
jgi:hypothetical protein